MWRAALGAVALAALCWLGINAVVTTDRERVEEEAERLIGLCRSGGEEAAEELLAALSGGYRGTSVPREEAERVVRNYVARKRIRAIKTKAVGAVWHGGEILFPLVARVDFDGGFAILNAKVTFAREGEEWKVVDVSVSRW
ncbi:MAG: hypothetical protein ACREID_07345 [Planctomycetota bacterium]